VKIGKGETAARHGDITPWTTIQEEPDSAAVKKSTPLIPHIKAIKYLLLGTSVLAISTMPVHALPFWKGGQTLEGIQKKSDLEQLDAHSRLVLVCKASNTVSIIPIKDASQAMKLCAEGQMIECKDCKKHFKVTWKNPSGKSGAADLKMEIVNSKGEPCMFLAKMK